MSKTYTLNSTAVLGCQWSSRSNNWRSQSNNTYAVIGRQGNYYKWVQYRFDTTTLASLRSKTITSVTLKIYSTNTFPTGKYGLMLAYAYAGSGNNCYRGNAAGSAASTANDTILGALDGSTGYGTITKSRSGSYYTLTLPTTKELAGLGYMIGPNGTLGTSDYWNLDTKTTKTAAVLTVVTNETDYNYTLTYNANGGSGAPSNQTGSNTGTSPSYTFTISSTSPSRTGYTFKGWSTSSTATTASYQPGGSITVTSSGTTTLYAVWQIDTWAVKYYANGHGTAPADQTKTYGQTLTLQPFISNVNGTENTVTITCDAATNGGTWTGGNGSAKWRPVYSQTYWNTNSSGTGTNYGSGASYTTNAALDLYAIWSTTNTGTSYTLPSGSPTHSNSTTNTLTVTFHANGGTTTKTSQTSSKTVTYSFTGWFTEPSGGVQRTSSSRVTAAETVYAQFSTSTGAQSSVTLPTIAQCTRSGFELLGWDTNSSATTPTYQPGESYTPSADIILYAIWKGLNTVHIVNSAGTGFDVYLVYVVNNNTLDPYKITVVNSAGTGLDTYT